MRNFVILGVAALTLALGAIQPAAARMQSEGPGHPLPYTYDNTWQNGR